MRQSRNLFLVLLLSVTIHSSTTYKVQHKNSCEIDDNKSVTVHNLRFHCSPKQLKTIFTNLPAGKFPPNGKLNGFLLVDGLQDQEVWNGKNIKYLGGQPPFDHGTLTNTIFKRYEMFGADIYRTISPVDGKEAFALNYQRDQLAFAIIDYIRQVQDKVYLGIMTIRPFEKIALLYFLLEKE